MREKGKPRREKGKPRREKRQTKGPMYCSRKR
jgi:hypothetical protein